MTYNNFQNPFLHSYVDRSIGKINYMKSIIIGRNVQVSEIRKHDGKNEFLLDGDFVLTIGKNIVILTRDIIPVIVKKWQLIPLEEYITFKNATPFLLSGVKIAEVYKDNDGWIWEGIVDDDGNHFQVKDGDNYYLFTISFI